MEDEELTEEERLEEEYEEALKHGRRIYNVYHDHGVVSSDASIYLWQGRYWAMADFDISDRGPFTAFEEALKGSGLHEFGEGCSVDCRALRQAQLLPLLEVHGDYFILNGHCRVRRMVKGTERWVLGEPREAQDGEV